MQSVAWIVAARDADAHGAGGAPVAQDALCYFAIAYCFKRATGNQNEIKQVGDAECHRSEM